MRQLMRRLCCMSLATQMVCVLLVALVLSQAIALLIHRDERANAVRAVMKEEFLARSASVARLLESTPESLNDEILRAGGSVLARYWLTPGQTDAMGWQQAAREHLLMPTPAPMPSTAASARDTQATTADFYRAMAALVPSPTQSWEALSADNWSLGRPGRLLQLEAWNGFGLEVRLADGTWLNAVHAKPASLAPSPYQSYVALGIAALTLSLVAVFTARRITRPLRGLALAAERLGRGEDVPPLPNEGPMDIRCTAAAFNRMRDRLRRFVADRTRMLAAIGHDLRTPITSMRLRAEFVSDEDTRQKLLATLNEMQAMTEATLAFAREDATEEPTRTVDLSALIESLCADLADLGWDVTFSNGEKIPYRCRPAALRRALRNLIENAVRYGERARVALTRTPDAIEITVDDDGPGIPEEDMERVFAPFVRLESSRNRTTGGVGLGLSIARTIVRGHGGDIGLANCNSLRATVKLPRA
jgi:signal transduction histidine kinase